MDKALQVCKVCGCEILSGYSQCDGSYYQSEDDSCAAGKRMESAISIYTNKSYKNSK